MDLVEFLRAMLDRDEQVAQGARPDYFTVETLGQFSAVGDMRHAIRHDTARVLAEVEAKRRLIDSLLREGDYLYEDEFKLLALPYASDPAYREEWRP